MRSTVTAQLRRPLEDALRRGHPWLWREALHPFRAEAGAVVTVVDGRGRFVARGLFDGEGPLAVRVFTTRDEALDERLARARVESAGQLRDRVVPPDTDAWRLLHGEGDRLPGVVCDVYGAYAVLATDGEGAAAWADVWASALEPALRSRGVTTLLLRKGRGPERTVEALWGAAPEETVVVRERGMLLRVDLVRGQKTGLFLDQREARARVRGLSRGLRVLNLYGYTGGFSVAAGLGGATQVTTVDLSAPALELAARTWFENGLDPALHRGVAEDVPRYLAEVARKGQRFDLVIADPPSFAPNEESLAGALRSYQTLHAAATALVAPGGMYLAGSCSSHVSMAAFQETLRDAMGRAGRAMQVLDAWGAPADHPQVLGFPEGAYLKDVLLRRAD